ncbi:MAG TPA: glycosyltransferase family 4 protein [Chitinophagales bacterium]|nr:glycosyltransferase family 4 protein [Chitinophagales bacterium]HRK25884.1 glycosyltransferase family 4 protein [Chitinophagales bacterium]
MEKKKVCYIISHINKSLGFEWTAASLQDEFELHFVLLGEKNTALAQFLTAHNITCHTITYTNKKDLPRAIIQVWRYLVVTKPAVVHTHLIDASLIGLTAAFFAGIATRIYTRHHSDYHIVYAPNGIKYDRWCNALATHIVAISAAVAQILETKEGVSPEKISLIHHGFNLTYFEQPEKNTVQQLQLRYNTAGKYPVIGVIARQTAFKGIHHIIAAFARLLPNYPNALLILANATGEFKPTLTQLLNTHVPPQNRCEIIFEPHIAELYALFDVHVHVPVSATCEAFGQTYVEALAARVPSVFTLSGVAPEFIVHEHNALVVPFDEVDSISEAIKRILTDSELRNKIAENGNNDVHKHFTLTKMTQKLIQLYNQN